MKSLTFVAGNSPLTHQVSSLLGFKVPKWHDRLRTFNNRWHHFQKKIVMIILPLFLKNTFATKVLKTKSNKTQFQKLELFDKEQICHISFRSRYDVSFFCVCETPFGGWLLCYWCRLHLCFRLSLVEVNWARDG